jgi:hypothetical protein
MLPASIFQRAFGIIRVRRRLDQRCLFARSGWKLCPSSILQYREAEMTAGTLADTCHSSAHKAQSQSKNTIKLEAMDA